MVQLSVLYRSFITVNIEEFSNWADRIGYHSNFIVVSFSDSISVLIDSKPIKKRPKIGQVVI